MGLCLLSHISPVERLFILKILSRTQQATKVVGFSLKSLHCRDPALPQLKAIHMVSHFTADSINAHYMHVMAPMVLHFSAFIAT